MKVKTTFIRGALGVGVIMGLLTFTSAALASTLTTFHGQDDGAPTTGPFPNSSAAQSAFETAASAFGSLNTITYEGLATGFYSPINAAPGVSITLTGTNFGAGYSGITNITYGNLYGFNTTPGGSQYLGTSGDTETFNFTDPTNSFGTWITGIQTVFTAALTINFDDGTSETLAIPVNTNGGAEFFGFTDTASFASVTLTDTSNQGTDAWGIDDTTYNTPATTPIPEPSSLFLLGSGVLGLAGAVRRRIKA